jgi:transcriptional regulator with XRE-family HTH domain
MSGEYRALRTQPKIGRILQQARQERGLSLEEVEQATKIRARHLAELERGNFGVLPDVYVRGFLKTYADYLQLDGKALARELKDQRASWPHEQNQTHGEPPKGSPDPPLIIPGIPPVGAEGRKKTAAEEVAGPPALVSAGSNYHRAYLVGSAALLVLAVAAVTLMLTLAGDEQQAVSQVREPVANPVALIGGGEVELTYQPQHEDDRRGAGYDSNNPQPKENNTGSEGGDVEDAGAGRASQSGQAQRAPLRAQNSREAAAALSAPMPDDTSTVPTPEASLQRRPQKTISLPPSVSPSVSPAPKLVPSIKARLFRRPTSAPTGRPGMRFWDRGDFDVRIKVGGNDPVRITGSPVKDQSPLPAERGVASSHVDSGVGGTLTRSSNPR